MSLPLELAATAEALLAPRIEQRILPGLDRMNMALDRLGHPERAFSSVVVLGTNGKGSTAALLAGVLQAHAVRVGLYTSPHLIAVEERIRVNGIKIASPRLAELVRDLSRFPELSYFETLTCAAISEFAGARVEVAVLEAGLGGRWDAVNAVDPKLALLTNVGTDHQAWLGPDRAAIAAEKAAALRGLEAIVGAWDAEVEPVIRATASPTTSLSLASQWARVTGVRGRETGVRGQGPGVSEPAYPEVDPIGAFVADHGPRATGHDAQLVRFRVGGLEGTAMLPLAGEHQRDNLELALAGAAALARHRLIPPLETASLRLGIESVRWPGRMQRLDFEGRKLLLDGAHNLEAMTALTAALDSLGLSGEVSLLFSCLADKPLVEMAALLRPRVAGVTVAPIESPRATPADALAAQFPGCRVAPSVADALAALPEGRPTLVTGSLRLVGEVLALAGVNDG